MSKCNFNKVAKQIALRRGCSPVNLPHIFRTPFIKNTSEGLLSIRAIFCDIWISKIIAKITISLKVSF